MPTPPYTSSLFLAAGQYCTHLRININVVSLHFISNLHDADEVKGPGDHDDAGGLLLPDHPPEVGHRRLRWTLGHDVGFRLHQTLREGRLYSNLQAEGNSSLYQSSVKHMKYATVSSHESHQLSIWKGFDCFIKVSFVLHGWKGRVC